jgi:hypothetical protein
MSETTGGVLVGKTDRPGYRFAHPGYTRYDWRDIIMSWIPGWDSITSANSWSNFYFWAGIIALLALGVFEVFSHRYTERKDELVALQQDETRRAHDEEIARLHLETAQANERGAEASQRAADAQLELTKLKTRRAQLLTPEAIGSIIEKLKPFSGTKFDIGHASEGREQWDFLWLLEPLFPQAGWVFVDWDGPKKFGKQNWTMQTHSYGVANVLNVSIELNPEGRERLLPAATALADALNGVGIAAVVEPQIIASTSTSADVIHLLVGEKG